MKKHLCVFFCYQQFDIIKESFESMYIDEVDFFIVENISENSKEIEEYFKSKNIKGHIRSNENISSTLLSVFIKDFKNLILKYEYFTITDGDLYVYDSISTFNELRECLTSTDVISSTRLYQGNNYLRKERIIGIDPYIKYMESKDEKFGKNLGHTGGYFLTVNIDNLWVFQDIHFTDSNIKRRVESYNKNWVNCKYSESYHLTWDLYVNGNPYYEWKKQVIRHIWSPKKNTGYKIIS